MAKGKKVIKKSGGVSKKSVGKYRIIDQLGKGAYGEVHKAVERSTKRTVAIKTTPWFPTDGVPHSTLREVAQLKYLADSPYVVSLLDVEVKRDKDGKKILNMVFECLDSDLQHYLADLRHSGVYRLPEKQLKNFSYQLLKATAFLHGRGIFHRDFKTPNVLVYEKSGILKMADFGLARSLRIPVPAYTPKVVTLWYRAPELFLGTQTYSLGVDMWAVGCILAELYLLRPLCSGRCDIDQLSQIFRMLGTPNESVWPGVTKLKYWSDDFPKFGRPTWAISFFGADPLFVDLLTKIFQYDPAKRISAKEALQHPFFDDVDESQY